MGNYDKHFWRSREQRKNISGSREHELKTFLGTRGFINGEQGIKSKKIKGSWEHVPPLGGAHLPWRHSHKTRLKTALWTAFYERNKNVIVLSNSI